MATLQSLSVSYEGALEPLPLKKAVGLDGQPVNIQTDPAGKAVYVWGAYADVEGRSVLEVRILLDGEELPTTPSPEAWVKVGRDLGADAISGKSYLCYRVGAPSAEEKPITAVTILKPGESPGEFLEEIGGTYTPHNPVERCRDGTQRSLAVSGTSPRWLFVCVSLSDIPPTFLAHHLIIYFTV
jgi:hypothetical protein